MEFYPARPLLLIDKQVIKKKKDGEEQTYRIITVADQQTYRNNDFMFNGDESLFEELKVGTRYDLTVVVRGRYMSVEIHPEGKRQPYVSVTDAPPKAK